MKRDPQSTRSQQPKTNRREFLKWSGVLAGSSALAAVAIPHVHAGEDNTIRLALIGSGNRGSGAVGNAVSSPNGPARLVAMADLFEQRMAASHKALSKQFGDKIDVPPERMFLGFGAFRQAIDCLRPGDVALLTTHAAFRAPHLEYAVEKGVNVFMEKSFASDPAGIRRILLAGEEADKKNLKVATGLMCRHSTARQALIQKIREGAMGQIQLIRAYRMQAGGASGPWKGGESELLAQIRRPHNILWVATGRWLDNMIHQVDECCWLKDAYPVSAHGMGGRVPGSTDCGQNLDCYSIEYTFADGAKAIVNGRFLVKCYNEFSTFVHGTKCAAQFSGNIHAPAGQMYRDQRIADEKTVWKPERETVNPWQAEWDVLLDSIRNDRPQNETKRSALSNLAGLMGRAAVHTQRIITWQEMLESNFQFCPDVDHLTETSPAPVQADAEGRYPAPIPGMWSEV